MKRLLSDDDWADDRLTEIMDMDIGIKPYYLSPLLPCPPVLAFRYNQSDGLYMRFEVWP